MNACAARCRSCLLSLAAFWTGPSGIGAPYFCKFICPAGTLEAGLPLLALNSDLRPLVGLLFLWKLAVLAVVIGACIVAYRPSCRILCPLGALYLQPYLEDWAGRGFEVYFVTPVTAGQMEDYMESRKVRMNVMLDPGTAFGKTYKVTGWPTLSLSTSRVSCGTSSPAGAHRASTS